MVELLCQTRINLYKDHQRNSWVSPQETRVCQRFFRVWANHPIPFQRFFQQTIDNYLIWTTTLVWDIDRNCMILIDIVWYCISWNLDSLVQVMSEADFSMWGLWKYPSLLLKTLLCDVLCYHLLTGAETVALPQSSPVSLNSTVRSKQPLNRPKPGQRRFRSL